MTNNSKQFLKTLMGIECVGLPECVSMAVPSHLPHDVYDVAFLTPYLVQKLWRGSHGEAVKSEEGEFVIPGAARGYRLKTDFANNKECPILINQASLEHRQGVEFLRIFDSDTTAGLVNAGAVNIPLLLPKGDYAKLMQRHSDHMNGYISASKMVFSVEDRKNVLTTGAMHLVDVHPVREMAELVDAYVAAGDRKRIEIHEAEKRAEALRPGNYDSVVEIVKNERRTGGRATVLTDASRQAAMVFELKFLDARRLREEAALYSNAPASQAAIDELVAAGVHSVRLTNPFRHDVTAKELQRDAAKYADQLVNPTGSPESLVSRLELTSARLQSRRSAPHVIDPQGIERLQRFQDTLRQAVLRSPEATAIARAELPPEVLRPGIGNLGGYITPTIDPSF